MKNYILTFGILLLASMVCNSSFADSPKISPNTGVHFVFCSLTKDNGCAQIAISSDPTLQTPALLWGTSHTEQGVSVNNSVQWLVLVLTSVATEVSNSCYAGPNKSVCQYFPSYSGTNWTTGTDYLAAESAGNITPYAKFSDGTYYEIKINIPNHGDELTPYFYVNSNPPPQPWPSLAKPSQIAQICYKQLDPNNLPSDGRLIQAAYTVGNNDNIQFMFNSINDVLAGLKSDGFTDLNFNQPSFNCN